MNLEKIEHNGVVQAILLRDSYDEPGVTFITPNDYSQQLGYMHHPAGKIILPHLHNPVTREVEYTQEVLFIKKGKVRVDFYDQEQKHLESRILSTGDVLLLIRGGHGFEVLEELVMIEVKQGPYVGEHDKIRFNPDQQARSLPLEN